MLLKAVLPTATPEIEEFVDILRRFHFRSGRHFQSCNSSILVTLTSTCRYLRKCSRRTSDKIRKSSATSTLSRRINEVLTTCLFPWLLQAQQSCILQIVFTCALNKFALKMVIFSFLVPKTGIELNYYHLLDM